MLERVRRLTDRRVTSALVESDESVRLTLWQEWLAADFDDASSDELACTVELLEDKRAEFLKLLARKYHAALQEQTERTHAQQQAVQRVNAVFAEMQRQARQEEVE